MNRGAWRATVHGVTKSRKRLKQLSMHALFAYKSNDNIKLLIGPETRQGPLNPKSFLIFTALRGISFTLLKYLFTWSGP